MTALADLPRALPSTARAWRTARITPLGELLAPGRLTATAVRLVAQIFLVTCLWRALYADTTSSAGLARDQAVTFAVLAALASRIRGLDRHAARDTVIQHVNFGTIIYWFLRPLPARRYYLYRALGDQIYGLAWAAVGFLLCWGAGVVRLPASTGATLTFGVSLLLGQVIFHYLTLLVDLMCFWTLKNNASLLILTFAQNLLSGAYAPLWYFPGWFRTMSSLLPFQATLNVPVSLYVGRIPVDSAVSEIFVQVAWVVVLFALTRFLWQRAAARVVSQGG